MSDIQQPVITYALRGMAAFEVTVHGPEKDLHSGMYGGSVHNPLQALAEIIAALHDADGRVTVPGFYEDVRELTAEERAEITRIPWHEKKWREETGAPHPWGEPEYSLRERVGARPTLEINGMAGGYFERGLKAIVPARAWAKITCRLVADQDPQKIIGAVTTHIEQLAPPTVRIEVTELGAAPAALVDINTPAMQAAIHAYEKGWGARPVFKREGGSLPVVADLQNKLHLPVVLMGFGLDTDGLHGPNEHFSIEMFHRGIHTAIHFLYECAKLP